MQSVCWPLFLSVFCWPIPLKRHPTEPAYILHRYDWSESSLILDAFTRRTGRVALVAKGAKRPSSSFRPVLLPLQPLHLAFGGDAEIKTLKSAEWVGGHVMPTGAALLSGLYLNELLMRLLPREDAHPALFDYYALAVKALAVQNADPLADAPQAALRAFELLLLRETGVLPQLDVQTLTLEGLAADERYTLVAEGGLVHAAPNDRALTGLQWLELQVALSGADSFQTTEQACAACLSELKPQLRTLLNYHCGTPRLRTRQLMMDLQNL